MQRCGHALACRKLNRTGRAGGDIALPEGVPAPRAHGARRHARETILAVGIGERLERRALDGDACELEVLAGAGMGNAAFEDAGGR